MTTTTQHQERVLCDIEEELVCVLSGKDPVEIANNLYKRNVLSNTMCDQFTSLDHSNLEPQLQIKYLLRLVCKRFKEDNCVWAKFLYLLSDMGGNFNIIRKKLEEELYKVTSSIEICPPTSTASGEPDIVLTSLHSQDLTESLVKVSHKWERLGIAVGLPKHVIENCRDKDNIISLSNIITNWLSGEANTLRSTTLHTLKKVLCGPIVAEPKIAEEVEERFRPVERLRLSLSPVCPTDSHMTIINQSGNTVVADGRSTLLLVQASHRESASYQWKKNGHVLVNSSTYRGVCEEILVISRARQGTEGEYTCYVSSEGRQASSNKIILTVEYSAAKKRLLDLYSVTSEVPSDSWPPSGTRTFINLALIKSSKEPTEITDYTVERSADKVIEEREKVECDQLFRECKSGELILLEGRPGSGKTTLVHKIIKDWTKGSMLENARWVMLITLRELNNIRAESLSDVVSFFSHNDEAIIKYIEKDTGEGLCFIIDGLDEYNKFLDTTKSPIYQLLDKTLLPKAMIIVSNRQSAIITLKMEKVTKRIETLGFTREEIFQYIDNFPFSCESDITTSAMYATKLKEYFHSNPNVFNMCYLPVHTAMICFLFKCKRGNIPITQTKIYEQCTRCIILRHLKRSNSKQQLESLQDLSKTNKKHFEELCHLAYEMTVNYKQVVIPQEMNVQLSDSSVAEEDRYLGLVTISHTAKLSGFHSTYTFLHLTFQEFLAAVYISSLNKEDQLEKIKNWRTNHMLRVWTFYCGLVRFISGDIRIQELFKKFKSDDLFQLAFESQQPTVCDDLVNYEHGQFNHFLSPSLLLALNYIMSSTSAPITTLTFSNNESNAVAALLCVLRANKSKLYHLQMLKISSITSNDQVFLLTNVLRASPNLRVAELYFKHIDADGMKSIAGVLKYLFQLQDFYLYVDNISSGITQLFSGLQHLQNTELYLHFKNHSSNCDMKFGKGLQQLTINRVFKLSLTDGNIRAEGAAVLGNGLLNLTQLHYLYLSNNNIGDVEVNYLSVGIKSLSNIYCLDLSHNNIGPCGATSLAGAIKHLNLRSLNLSNNNIGCGARILANTLQHQEYLQELYLSGNNISLDSAIVVVNALKNCPCHSAYINKKEYYDKRYEYSIQVQGLVSPGDDASIAALVAAVQHNMQDREVELGFKKIKVPSKHHEYCD